MKTREQKITAVALFVAALVAVAGWFAVLSPQRATIDTVRADTADLHRTTEQIEAQIPPLVAQLESVGVQIGFLRDLALRVPRVVDVPALNTELDAVASAAGVTLTERSFSTPQVITAPDNGGEDTVGQVDGEDVSAGTGTYSVIATFDVTLKVPTDPGGAAALFDALAATERLTYVEVSSWSNGGEGGAGTLSVAVTFFLQKVDVNGLVAQIEALLEATGSSQ